MGLRAARMRYGWPVETKLGIIGLSGGYHGDTIGAMDCAEPSAYNEKIEWYEGKGMWFEPPSVKCVRGKWVITIPGDLQTAAASDATEFASLSDVFDLETRESGEVHKMYEAYIDKMLRRASRARSQVWGTADGAYRSRGRWNGLSVSHLLSPRADCKGKDLWIPK